MKKLRLLFFLSLLSLPLMAQVDIYDSGGPLMPEQAAYDVLFYELDLEIMPDKQEIDGHVTVRAKVVHPTQVLVLDLDTLLDVHLALEKKTGATLAFERRGGKVWIDLGRTFRRGTQMEVQLAYGGKPRVAPRPPWDGGFTWEKTPSGAHWIATSNQTIGADVWWPNKDHVSDEPDSMRLRITVPEDLYVATNGHLQGISDGDQGTRVFDWYISTPINNYNVAMNIAPYEIIDGSMKSITGEEFPVIFYVLPEDLDKGKILFEEIKEHVAFYEKYLGPYPFRIDKYGVAQTPHLGMEHQTIIAYGANFDNGSMTGGKDWGFDALHHHELGHEWWGNLVTNYDWKDMWIHEGFCSYMQAIYMEELKGKEGYHAYMNNMRFGNTRAVSPRETSSSQTIYRSPIYTKGAWALHGLRYLLGDKTLFEALRRFCYPMPAMESVKNGQQCRFVTTDDFIQLCEKLSGKELDWYFDVYLRQAALPTLVKEEKRGRLNLRWETPNDLPFTMPVDVRIGGEIQRVEVTKEGVSVPLKSGQKAEIDPEKWVMMKVQ